MHSFINYKELEFNQDCREKLEFLYYRFMEHKFNLLGSGDVKMDFSFEPKGFHGIEYDTAKMKYYGKLHRVLFFGKKREYEPINWFVDYKSGFFFDPFFYNSRKKCLQVIGNRKGVDIKAPWELGRMYHLPSLALYACVADKNAKEAIIKEFYNEIMDFIKANPIGRTVQWSAPMDTAIRIVNILIAFDILKQMDDMLVFTDTFEKKLTKLIQRSARYVIDHIEYNQERKAQSNHYLSNLAGLLFAAAYLPSTKETDAWLVFSVQELIEQVKMQYHEEGSNFEGSTSYHRLSTEFVLYSTALVYGVLASERRSVFSEYHCEEIERLKAYKKQKYNLHSPQFFPQWYLERLCNAGQFTKSVLKQNNEIVQVGDNDSGRLLKLSPIGDIQKESEEYFEEKVIDHRTLLSSMAGLFHIDLFKAYGTDVPLEKSLVSSLSGNKKIFTQLYDPKIERFGSMKSVCHKYYKESCIFEETDENKKSLLDDLKIEHYPRFGIVILRSDRIFLSFVIDTTKYTKLYGHTHNDKLSIELLIDNRYITRDPGGYIYTAAPKIRDCFRSVTAHNCIHVQGKEQNMFTGTFGMKKASEGELLYCDNNTIIGKAVYLGVEHIRKIQVLPHRIVITDYANKPFTVSFTNKILSTGYGKLVKGKMKKD